MFLKLRLSPRQANNVTPYMYKKRSGSIFLPFIKIGPKKGKVFVKYTFFRS